MVFVSERRRVPATSFLKPPASRGYSNSPCQKSSRTTDTVRIRPKKRFSPGVQDTHEIESTRNDPNRRHRDLHHGPLHGRPSPSRRGPGDFGGQSPSPSLSWVAHRGPALQRGAAPGLLRRTGSPRLPLWMGGADAVPRRRPDLDLAPGLDGRSPRRSGRRSSRDSAREPCWSPLSPQSLTSARWPRLRPKPGAVAGLGRRRR